MPNRTREEKIDGWIINGSIFIKALIVLVLIKPLKGLRWFARRYPKPSIAMILGGSAALIAEKVFSGQLDPKIFSLVLVVVLIAFAVMLTAMVPVSSRDPGVEFAPRN
jgi:hypothetical protein